MRFIVQPKFIALSLFFVIICGTTTAKSTQRDSIKHSSLSHKPWPVSRYSIRAGGFWAISSTEAGLGTNNNPYSILDMENDLGLNRHTASFLLNLNSRFGKHHRVDLSYFYINRNSSSTIDKDIDFGDNHYEVNTQVRSYFNTNIVRLSYGFAFVSNKKMEVGALIGAHVMAFGIGLRAEGDSQQLDLADKANFTAPLPDLGLWGTYAFHRNWAISSEIGYFGIKIKNITGRLLSGSLSVQRRFGDHWALDMGYTYFSAKVNLDRPHMKADFKWSYSGPSLTAVYRFNGFRH